MALALVSALLLALGLWRTGLRHRGYSHIGHTISELGEAGAPCAKQVAFGVFLPFGLSMMALGWLSRGSHPPAAALAACIGVGYLGAALFPCDPGSPLIGSWRQTLHNLAGAIQYVGGAAVIWRLQMGHAAYALLAWLVGGAAVLLSVPAARPWRGGVQRVAELALLASLVLVLRMPHAA